MGPLMAATGGIERIFINDLALCLQIVVVTIIVIITIIISRIRSSLGPQRGLAASPIKLWLSQSSKSQSNLSNLPFLQLRPKGRLRSLGPGRMTASG